MDRTLAKLDHIITADAIILDQCHSWFNLVGMCLEDMELPLLNVWE